MITNKYENKIMLSDDVEILEGELYKFAYTDQLFNELGVDLTDGVEPLRGDDPWYLQGKLHGLHIFASYNAYENLSFKVEGKRVSYKSSIKQTLNEFIELYREGWHENNNNRGREKSAL